MIYQSINTSLLELLEYGRSKAARAGRPHAYPGQLLNPPSGTPYLSDETVCRFNRDCPTNRR